MIDRPDMRWLEGLDTQIIPYVEALELVARTTRRDHLTGDGQPREGHAPLCMACAAHLALDELMAIERRLSP